MFEKDGVVIRFYQGWKLVYQETVSEWETALNLLRHNYRDKTWNLPTKEDHEASL